MSANSDRPIILLGLKGTGKTHYLVALDFILDRQSDPDGLQHDDLADDRAYLQPLREKWLRGQEFERTSRTNPPSPHHLIASHKATGNIVKCHLPDLAGETFDSHFVTRSFPMPLRDRLRECSGILLFVHCDSNSDHAILEGPVLVDGNKDTLENVKPPIASDWQPEDASRQVKLVDLLQFVSEVRRNLPPIRVAVLTSAWEMIEKLPDLVRKKQGSPARFLAQHWPLLTQYLISNDESFEFRVFGVSARGGGALPDDIKRLIGFDDPTDRILVVDGDHRLKDLSRPIRWILDLLESQRVSGSSG